MASSVSGESTLHCKLNSRLHWETIRYIFWVGRKLTIEIPIYV